MGSVQRKCIRVGTKTKSLGRAVAHMPIYGLVPKGNLILTQNTSRPKRAKNSSYKLDFGYMNEVEVRRQ